jgi:O-antigen/teichoic acid export membrane protein
MASGRHAPPRGRTQEGCFLTSSLFHARVLQIARESALLFLALSSGGVANYAFHVLVGRMLEPGEYGALGAILALSVWLSIPLAAVQTYVAKKVSNQQGTLSQQGTPSDGRVGVVWSPVLRTLCPIAIGASAVLILVTPLIWAFLRLDSPWTVVFMSSYLVPAALLAVLRGALQGSSRFRALAVVSLAPILVRLTCGVWLVGAGAGVAGAMAASLVAEAIGVVLALVLLDVPMGSLRTAGRDAKLLRKVKPLALGLGGMWFIIQLDLLMTRHLLDASDSGYYAAAGLLARAVLFVPAAVSLVALPRFSEGDPRGERAFGWLVAALATTLAVCVPMALGFTIAGDLVVGLTFGGKFEHASTLLPLMGFGMIGFALANLLLYFHVAAGSRASYLLWPLAGAEALVMLVLPEPSPWRLACITVVSGWSVAGLGAVAARSLTRQAPHHRLPMAQSLSWSGWAGSDRQTPELSLVIPVCDGAASAVECVDSVRSVLEGLGRSHEIIVIADGSRVRGDSGLQALASRADVLHYARRQGKATALRVGMRRARGRYVAFLDADGDLDAAALGDFVAMMDLSEPDLVIGSKRHPHSSVEYPKLRRAMSVMYQCFVRLLFGLNVSDTQTGMKLIRKDVLDAVLPRMLEKRFAFDLEFLVIAQHLGFDRVVEAPIKLTYGFKSTVALQDVARIGIDSLAIFYRRYIVRTYDYPARYIAVSAAALVTAPDGATPSGY